MTRVERANFAQKTLAGLYPDPPIPLDHHSDYTLLIAVLLSAQCTDIRVNKVTPQLFAAADTPEHMAQLSVEHIQSLIRSCGLSPQKAKAIKGLSLMLCQRYDGKVPQDMEALEQLPGVGHKTAGVVMCQAFNQAAFPVDTHIHRLAKRWGLSNGRSVTQTERDLKKMFPKKEWHLLHLRMIYYGREYCTARACKGLHCFICTTCYPKRKTPV